MSDHSAGCIATKTNRGQSTPLTAKRGTWGLDGRPTSKRATIRRLRTVMRDIAAQVGIACDLNDTLLRRAGELTIAAEQARRSLIRGVHSVGIENVVKLENLAARSLRDLATRAKAAPSTQPTLEQYLQERLQDESEVAQ